MHLAKPSINQYIGEISELVGGRLESFLPEGWEVPESLAKSMKYSLMAGGKRLRPLLVIAAAESLGASREAALPVACAVEMVHTYSLIHDDLPAMDDDDFRRGKPTNHKVFGEATAILAGDGLLTHAFYSAVQAARQPGVKAEEVLAIVEELAVYAGPSGMVGGQVADMEGEQGLTDLQRLRFIHEHKTADLIVFSLKAGGRIAAATSAQLSALETYGRALGLAFQIQDDILDLVGDEAKLGKKTQSDVKQGKVTYPYFLGMEASRAEVDRLTRSAKEAVTGGSIPNPERLLDIADYLLSRDH
ncbi:polyprenyl synthetase family protein [Paenibacillus sp. alder61]|uniref:Farnesyl diphosphate synthase n=1 Tax=Paenibacillus faecis TaxID=862114 RepID=A0A5D0CTB5_9BACL|nr:MULTISPECIES: farnesyl diphosphate synthase [Paenibacillus]MCA1295877.1 polyprenyl synthetase family protein [Paenibacillus sp. alder61]TYA13216.1 polyprenyl synthetase family protein [Paenibacillus faecis]